MSENKINRPELSFLINFETKDIEQFQNQVLRPILKMQHSILIALFCDYLIKKKVSFSNLKLEKQKKHIEGILSKDIAYRNLQIGIVLGQLSIDEYNFYKENSNKLSRRIIQMLKQRLKDSISKILV